MSRVHDALRRAEQLGISPVANRPELHGRSGDVPPGLANDVVLSGERLTALLDDQLEGVLDRVEEIPYSPAEEAHLISLESPAEMPGEEFRSLRTRLNHLQTMQKLHTIVVTSASPAEGKTFTAFNLALTQAQLSENPVLMADLDLRRPSVHRHLQLDRGLGFSDYIQGNAPLEKCLRKLRGTSLYLMTAGSPVKNPLEILGAQETKVTIEQRLPRLFNWAILDSPPLLFSADANLLATLTDGTLIVVRVGATTYDNIVRAMQTLCENNVLGIVVNGARAQELYSKFTYYYSKTD
jgi:capsular exopolysaccharide synthesis family protein